MKPFHKMKRAPPHAEDLVAELRKRVQMGYMTFKEAEVRRIADVLQKLSERCAEAYQVVGHLAQDADCIDDRAVVKAMDLLFQPLRRGEMLPFSTPGERAKVAEHRRLKKKQAAQGGKPTAGPAAKARPARKRAAKKIPA